MNILLINHYAGSPKYGMEYRPYYLAKEWSDLGHNVRIIASSESHLHQLKPSVSNRYTLEKIDNIEYLWIKTPAYNGNGLGRIINMLSFSKKLFSERKAILNRFSPDIVIASSPHPFIFRGAHKIAKKANAKLIFEVRDIWPLSLIEILGLSKIHPLIALMQYEESNAYKKTDMVASLLPKAMDHMSRHGLSHDKFMYIPNGIIVKDWNSSIPLPPDHIEEVKQFKLQFNFLIGYAGTHGKPNALSFLIQAAELITTESIGIVLIGSGPEKPELISLANKLKLNNVLFLNALNKTRVPAFLTQMDALYIGWEQQSLYRFGISANKLFEYMISGKPIIHSVTAGNDPVLESGCGISCLPENVSSIAQALIQLNNLPHEELEDLGKKGKKYVIQNHDYALLAKKYLSNFN